MNRLMTRVALFALTLPFAGTAIAQADPAVSPVEASAALPATEAGGNLTLAQFTAQQESRMMAADTDHDGRISLAEWTAAMNGRHSEGGAGGGHRGGGFDPARMFDRMDTNHDGFLDKSEIDAAAAERFARMDANSDGVVTPEERSAPHGGGGWHHGG